MTAKPYPKLCFDYDFDPQVAADTYERGYWGCSHVQLADGSTRRVVFYDADRLAQDLEVEASHGRPYIAEQGTIVLEAVNLENMGKAIELLHLEGFFD